MVLAVEELDLEVDHGEAGDEAPQPRVLDALLDRGDEVLGDRPAEDVVDELEVARRAGRGFMRILQSPNWPWPPVCFLWRPWPSAAALIVSR